MGDAKVKRVLMMAPSFLADRRHKRIHGAEVFNLLLVRALVSRGVEVTVAAEPRWEANLKEHLGDLLGGGLLKIVYGPKLRKPMPTSLAVATKLAFGQTYDLLILGNVARGILPAARLLLLTRRVERVLLIAHQYPRESYVRSLRRFPAVVAAASEAVAKKFRRPGGTPVDVHFGIQNPEEFFPAPTRGRAGGKVRFCVIGVLDTPWKGVHLPLEAWDLLPEGVRERAELHLCAFKSPPVFKHASIVHRDWVAPSQVGALLREMDVMIVPSTASETFSQVMVQGMLTGLPQIVYNLDVLTEKLDTGGGVVFTTASELAGQIGTMVSDADARARMGEEARRVASERYIWSAERFIEKYLPG